MWAWEDAGTAFTCSATLTGGLTVYRIHFWPKGRFRKLEVGFYILEHGRISKEVYSPKILHPNLVLL